MTRGTLFYYESDDKVWSSTEFNGDMSHGTEAEPQEEGDKVIKLMIGLKSLDDFKNVLKEINKDYGYEEGNDCWPVGEVAIKEYIEASIKWIDNERTDLKGDAVMDPREWKKIPSFKDVRTWQFWGVPNLSDYSYIYNNSGKDLVIKTRSKPIKMVIPDGTVGVLNYGSRDCICKDGKIIDGFGNYEESEEVKASEDLPPMSKKEFYNYITENFTLDGTSRNLILNILDYAEHAADNKADGQAILTELLDGIGLEGAEIAKVEM